MAKQKAVTMVVWVCILALLTLPSMATEKCTINSDNSLAPPDFADALANSYTLTIEMTDIMLNETYYIDEIHERKIYHDVLMDVIGLRIIRNDTVDTYQYYPEKDVIVREFDGACYEMAEQPKFWYGWVDKDPAHGSKNIGPSSILRKANFLKTEYSIEPPEPEEGVEIEEWVACDGDNVKIQYHYNKPPWLMPGSSMFVGTEGMVPVQIKVDFIDGTASYRYSFTDIFPYVESHSLFEPPRGMGCEGIVGLLTDEPPPVLPQHFSLAEEVLLNSLIDGHDYGNQHLDKSQLTYAGDLSIVSFIISLPYDNLYSTSYAVRFVQDFNTGVQYTIFKEYGNCSRDFIPPFTFDGHMGGFFGDGDTLLSANGMFHLDDKFAYVGEHGSRGLSGDLWTSTRRDDIPDPTTGGIQNFEKAVLEYYFAQGAERKPSGELVETNLPFRSDLFVYNKSNPDQIVTTLTNNYYDFRIIDLFSPDEFSVEECFEKYDDDWSYMDIFFPVTAKNQLIAASEEQTRFKHEVYAKMIEIGRLSPVRIASIDVNTGISGVIPNTTDADTVIAKIKLLDRAPYIYSYRQPDDEMLPKPGKNEKLIPNIRREEDCAVVCSTTTDLECKAFHQCGDECYLSKTEGPDGDILDIEGSCKHWVYDLHNRTFEDYPSETVYTSVFDAVRNGEFIFNVPYRNNTGGASFEAKMSLHYRTPDPMDPIRKQFTLEAKTMTVAHPNNTIPVSGLTECMLLCVGWVRYRCETIIHQTQEGLCLLLAIHYHDLPHSELVPHSESFVHGRSYLVDYSPILGGVALNTTGPTYNLVEHLESCARLCTTETSIECQSFEWCPSNQLCHLHAEHYLDVVDSGNYITGTACIHFSAKKESMFTKYEDQGLLPSQHKLASHLTSPSACAKLCLEDENEVCQSYDFCSACDKNNVDVCGEENMDRIGLCFLATHHLGESDLTLTTGKGCDHYDRDVFGDQDYAGWVSSQRKSDNPYTAGDMTGLAFGMIFLGILVSVAFLAGITYCRPASVPKDFELSFQRLKTSGESSI